MACSSKAFLSASTDVITSLEDELISSVMTTADDVATFALLVLLFRIRGVHVVLSSVNRCDSASFETSFLEALSFDLIPQINDGAFRASIDVVAMLVDIPETESRSRADVASQSALDVSNISLA
jgi:hypothetical protein